MVRKIAYWSSTAIAAASLLMAVTYLSGSEQVVSGFAKAGYPQHLRIVLLLPGLALLKEWAYAGVTFAWVMAFISGYLSGEKGITLILPLVLLVLGAVSYVTRPPSRRVHGSPAIV